MANPNALRGALQVVPTAAQASTTTQAMLYLPLLVRGYPESEIEQDGLAPAWVPYQAKPFPRGWRGIATAAIASLASATAVILPGRNRKKPTASHSCGRPSQAS